MQRKTKVGYQGAKGAYSHKASKALFKNAEHIGFETFEELTDALCEGRIDKAVMPISNSNAGRVFSAHNLIFEKNLYIVDEFFLRVEHNLLARNRDIKNIKYAYSHPQALAQSSKFLRKNKLQEAAFSDTALAAKFVSEQDRDDIAAIASDLAAKEYGLQIVAKNIENDKDNTTRFVVLARQIKIPATKTNVITSVFFITKNIPAALYKALGGFATENINLLNIESFVPMKRNGRAKFYLEFEAHPEQENAKRALDELKFYSEELRVLGVYKERKHR